jgi:hypothetical protein
VKINALEYRLKVKESQAGEWCNIYFSKVQNNTIIKYIFFMSTNTHKKSLNILVLGGCPMERGKGTRNRGYSTEV